MPMMARIDALTHSAIIGGVADVPMTVARLRDLVASRDRVSLDGQRTDDTFVLEHRGSGWLVFYLERGRKREFRKHASEDAACRDLLGRLAS
jgi:hypothetical protein